MRKLAFLSIITAFSVALASPAPVSVFFGPFAWVYAQSAMPRVVNGQTLVPVLEGCELLGLKCVSNGTTYTANGENLTIVRHSNDPVPFTPLKNLAELAGQAVTWDAPSRTARVTAGEVATGARGWPFILGLNDHLGQAVPPKLNGPLSVTLGAVQRGVPTINLTLRATQPLKELTLFTKTQGNYSYSGSLVQSSVDVPNRFPGCQGAQTCTLPMPRGARWTLAYLTLSSP